MREARVGRVLVASLHQGVGDVLPMRLGFYEQWLHVEGLREGTIGAAQIQAVLSFLRQEGDAYDAVTTRAGDYGAEWTAASMTRFQRALLKTLPVPLRRRLLLNAAGRLVRASWQESRAVARVRKGIVRIDLTKSIFCGVREPVIRPLCGFYAAVYTGLLRLCDVQARASIISCQATGQSSCTFEIPLTGTVEVGSEEAEAA